MFSIMFLLGMVQFHILSIPAFLQLIDCVYIYMYICACVSTQYSWISGIPLEKGLSADSPIYQSLNF